MQTIYSAFLKYSTSGKNYYFHALEILGNGEHHSESDFFVVQGEYKVELFTLNISGV